MVGGGGGESHACFQSLVVMVLLAKSQTYKSGGGSAPAGNRFDSIIKDSNNRVFDLQINKIYLKLQLE